MLDSELAAVLQLQGFGQNGAELADAALLDDWLLEFAESGDFHPSISAAFCDCQAKVCAAGCFKFVLYRH